jgi:ribosomal protein S18 acetylase RimI-like enzyme
VSSTEHDLGIRPASDEDVEAVAEVLVRARRAAVPLMPRPVHPDHDAPAYVRTKLHDADAWVAEVGGRVVGFALTQPGWLDMLYVLPDHVGRGIGSALLDLVKHHRRAGFSLRVFESNTPARRFYRDRGLVELERADGDANEEGAPDIRMAWPGHDPMVYLRSQVDEVDADLAAVIARRVALTLEIQRHKDVAGHAGRDESREAEIAERMAGRAPVLTAEEWRRIVHEVISVSLDATERAEEA